MLSSLLHYATVNNMGVVVVLDFSVLAMLIIRAKRCVMKGNRVPRVYVHSNWVYGDNRNTENDTVKEINYL